MTILKIEMVIDLVCSWCPIGYRNVQDALDVLRHEVSADIHFLPYQLNPGLSYEGEEIDQHLKRRTGRTDAEVLHYKSDVVARAKAVGLTYDYAKRTHYWNTFKAHCLLNAAAGIGKHTQLYEALTLAYYGHGENLSDIRVLLNIAEASGISERFVLDALWSARNRDDVRRKERRVRHELGIRSIPSFLINDRVPISGSNSAAFFVQAFRDIATASQLENAC
jgi:predicted DsbA family dithiol-disulfide isomerase